MSNNVNYVAINNKNLTLKLNTDCQGGNSVKFIAKANIPSIFGKFTTYGFLEQSTGKEHMAIMSGEIDTETYVSVRIHSECWTGEVMGSLKCDCRDQLEAALAYIGQESGLVLYLRQEGRGIGLLNKIKAYALQEQGLDTVEANHKLGFDDDLRTYEAAIKILNFFNISKVRLLTNNPKKITALEEAGIQVKRQPHQLALNSYNIRYLKTKAAKSGHILIFDDKAELNKY